MIYLLLASLYLVYAPDAAFVSDDWVFLRRFEDARAAGLSAQVEVVASLIRNELPGQFRFFWLSYLITYIVWLAVGSSAQALLVVTLVVHTGSAVALRQAFERLGISPAGAFLAGALFVLLPSTHGVVFSNLAGAHYLWGTFFAAMYLRSVASSFAARRLDHRALAAQAGWVLLMVFSADAAFGVVLFGAPVLAWFLRSRAGLRAALAAWATAAVAVAGYTLWINRAPIGTAVGLRFEFSLTQVARNLAASLHGLSRTTGFVQDSFYHLQATPTALAAALAAAGLLWWLLRRIPAEGSDPGRTFLLATALWLAARGPTLLLRTAEFRYEYLPTPFLALTLALLIGTAGRHRLTLTAALVAFTTLASVNDIEQSWVPQSRRLQALAAGLRQLRPVEPGDHIIVPDIPLWIGTAPHFAFQGSWASTAFCELTTGVRRLETAVDIVREGPVLRAIHFDTSRLLDPAALARTWVLAHDPGGNVRPRYLAAEAIGPDAFRLWPLRGYQGPPVPDRPVRGEQLALHEGRIYLIRPH